MERFDIDALDETDPFELDKVNLPHLFKHMFDQGRERQLYIGIEEIRDLYRWEAARYFPADPSKGDAHWLLVGELAGFFVTVPLAPSESGDITKCRPIAIYEASATERELYISSIGGEE